MSDYIIHNGELYHYGIKGMKWGHRKSRAQLEKEAGTFRDSNGMKVAPSKNAYVRTMRRVAANRNFEKYSSESYRNMMKNRNADTVTNRLETAKGEKRMRSEAQALREYNAHIKDLRKGTGDKHLKKAIRDNKIDDAYEKIQSDSSKLDRQVFSNETRKRAARYVVDNNMSVKEATKKAKKEAASRAALLVGAYGALTVAEFYANKK